MKRIFVLLPFLFTLLVASAQTLYSKAYGNSKDKPIIFIHGGPGGNATLFEATTAQALSEKGFYVIVYDRRGEGRSADENAKFTYAETFEDLNAIYKKYGIRKADIIGHSFGGLVAALYSERYPAKTNSIILASALVSQQETYDHIINSVKKIYTDRRDSIMLKQVFYVEHLDKNSAEYRNKCFELANDNGYFNVSRPAAEANDLIKIYEESAFYKTNIRNKNAPMLFCQNESRTNIDTQPTLKELKSQGINLYAIYGKQDGIFSQTQMDNIKSLVGDNNFSYIENGSHYIFVDQQQAFLDSIEKWLH